MEFSTKQRTKYREQLASQTFDLLIIGGGITGCGIALDAAQRGMKVALIEKNDFASGTSSKSTKLVHGGLRYLKQAQIGVVYETGRERAIVYENGPHVTTPEWMLLPFHAGGTFGKFTTSIGLAVYDRLAGVKKSERRSMLTAQETLSKAPLVKPDGLKGGGYYVEYRTDDARLVIEVLKKAREFGAVAINYTLGTDFIYNDAKEVVGMSIEDSISHDKYDIKAKQVVNATGPWVDDVRFKDYVKNNKNLRLTKGVHLVFDGERFPLQQSVYFDTESDGRMIFAIPRDGKTYVGTTDTFYEERPINPKPTSADRQYVVDAINYMFPSLQLTVDDIESQWAGVRPLIWEEGKDPSEISRKDEIWMGESNLMTIAGGKLTGYRHMAQEVVDKVAQQLSVRHQLSFAECVTKTTPISGGDFGGSAKQQAFIESSVPQGVEAGLSEDEARFVAKYYGTNCRDIYAIARASYDLAKSADLSLLLYSRLIYSLDNELVLSPTDFFIRRTGLLFFNIREVMDNKVAVINVMAQYLSWTEEQKIAYTKELDEQIYQAMNAND